MRKKIMTLMMGTLLLLTACGQTGNSSASTMLPVAAVQSAAQGVAGVADKTADKAEMPQKNSLHPLKWHRPLHRKSRQYPRLHRRIHLLPHPHRHLHRNRQRNRRNNLRLRLPPNLRPRRSLPPAGISTPSRRLSKWATSTQERNTV